MAKSKPNPITDLNKEEMLVDYVGGMPLTKVAEKHGVNYVVLTRHAKKEGWKEAKDMALTEVGERALVAQDVVRDETMDKTMRMIHKLVTDAEKRMEAGDDAALRVNLKTLVDAMEKLIKLKMHVDSGGVETKNVHIKKETVDWNKLIEQSVKAKQQYGDAFDEKAFLQQAIDAEVKK